MVVGAIDWRVKCVVAQVPLASGHDNARRLIRADYLAAVQKMFCDDRRARMAGKPPTMTPVVAEDPAAPSALPTPDSWKWSPRPVAVAPRPGRTRSRCAQWRCSPNMSQGAMPPLSVPTSNRRRSPFRVRMLRDQNGPPFVIRTRKPGRSPSPSSMTCPSRGRMASRRLAVSGSIRLGNYSRPKGSKRFQRM